MLTRPRTVGAAVAVVVGVLTAAQMLGAGAASSAGDLPAGALSVVVGGHAGMPVPRLTGQAAQATDLAAVQGAQLSVIVADGSPFVSTSVNLPDPASGSDGADARSANQKRIETAVRSARARTSETDLLAALVLAGDQVRSGTGLRTVVVDDSGLSTSGGINFTLPGMLDADPQDVAGFLADVGRLPDLSGAMVVFQGLGETVPPQAPLSGIHRERLQRIWSAVAERAGALDVRFDSGVVATPPPAGLPPVIPVPVDPTPPCSGGTTTLQGGAVTFVQGSPNLVDPEGAVAMLKPMAQRIITGGLTAEIFGTAASIGETSLGQSLSEQRAQTVANILIQLGVPVSELRVQGLGSNFPGYVPDRDPQGHLLPDKAALNRHVTVSLSKDGKAVSCP